MIYDKVFGIYISPFSRLNKKIGKGDTIEKERTSSIRFGGFDEGLMSSEELDQIWIHTIDDENWNIPL